MRGLRAVRCLPAVQGPEGRPALCVLCESAHLLVSTWEHTIRSRCSVALMSGQMTPRNIIPYFLDFKVPSVRCANLITAFQEKLVHPQLPRPLPSCKCVRVSETLRGDR